MTFPNLQLETDHFHRTFFFTAFHSFLLQFFVPSHFQLLAENCLSIVFTESLVGITVSYKTDNNIPYSLFSCIYSIYY